MGAIDVNRLKAIGYFDRIALTGSCRPMQQSLEICGGTLHDCLDALDCRTEHDFVQVKVYIVGEAFDAVQQTKRTPLNYDRAKLGLRKYFNKNGTGTGYTKESNSLYVICEADVTVYKGTVLSASERAVDDVRDWALNALDSTDEQSCLVAAAELSEYISKEICSTCDCVAIIDKVYTDVIFRGCGVSTWLHQNLQNILYSISNICVTGAVLMVGDYTHESEAIFNMTPQDYIRLLTKHYNSCGYENITKLFGLSAEMDKENIMYKLL